MLSMHISYDGFDGLCTISSQNANKIIISTRIRHSVWYIYTDRLCRNSFIENVAGET